MLTALDDPRLDAILSSLSRSFYLSLRVLPRPLRAPLSTAYLVARAADTIADTEAVPRARRSELLEDLRRLAAEPSEEEAFGLAARVREALGDGVTGDERRLLDRLEPVLDLLGHLEPVDRAPICRAIDALACGMQRDLARFDGVRLVALDSIDELDEHCYLAAGCVGELWSSATAAHFPDLAHLASPDLRERGVRLGKALQMVNVLRDAPADLAAGRCYLPRELLAERGLAPEDLLLADRRRSARPVFDRLRTIALGHVDAAWPYVLALPPTAPRLRLACVWPLWIGLATLELLGGLADPLDGAARRKIDRPTLHRIVAESLLLAPLGPLLERRHHQRRAAAE